MHYQRGSAFQRRLKTGRGGVATQISELARAQLRVRAVASVSDRAAVTTVEPVSRIALTRQRARRREIPAIRLGKFWRFRRSSLDAWMLRELVLADNARERSCNGAAPTVQEMGDALIGRMRRDDLKKRHIETASGHLRKHIDPLLGDTLVSENRRERHRTAGHPAAERRVRARHPARRPACDRARRALPAHRVEPGLRPGARPPTDRPAARPRPHRPAPPRTAGPRRRAQNSGPRSSADLRYDDGGLTQSQPPDPPGMDGPRGHPHGAHLRRVHARRARVRTDRRCLRFADQSRTNFANEPLRDPGSGTSEPRRHGGFVVLGTMCSVPRAP